MGRVRTSGRTAQFDPGTGSRVVDGASDNFLAPLEGQEGPRSVSHKPRFRPKLIAKFVNPYGNPRRDVERAAPTVKSRPRNVGLHPTSSQLGPEPAPESSIS